MACTGRANYELQKKAQQQLAGATSALEKLRLQCLSRGANGIQGLGRQFKIIDDDGSKSLDMKEFVKGCQDFGCDLTKDEMREVFETIDKDGSGVLDFDEFLIALRPPMSKCRMQLITTAFNKLDKTKDGKITVEDLKGVFNCSQHPKYKNGEWTEDQVFGEFLKTFETPNQSDGTISQSEFVNYYAGVSASIDNDAYFVLVMKTAYGI